MILIFGDVHGQIDHLYAAIEAEKPSAVIFLGDIESPVRFDRFVSEIESKTEVWWIQGNHDTDTEQNYINLFESDLAERNLHGRVVEIDGVRVAGLGGVFRSQIWYPPEHPKYLSFDGMVANKYRHNKALTSAELARLHYLKENKDARKCLRDGQLRKHQSSIFYSDWLQLFGQRADILVTHEAPSCHPYGFSEIDQLAKSMRVKYAFHGHQHDSLNYRSFDEKFGFQAHGVGFRGVTDMFGGKVVVGSFDEGRSDNSTKKGRS
jgi:predicted phosphodiesterase